MGILKCCWTSAGGRTLQVFGCVASHLSKFSSEDQAYDVSVCRGYKILGFHNDYDWEVSDPIISRSQAGIVPVWQCV
jgi:hypothetical protein